MHSPCMFQHHRRRKERNNTLIDIALDFNRHMPVFQNLSRGFPQAALAIAILYRSSLSWLALLEIVLPRYLKSYHCIRASWLIVIVVGSGTGSRFCSGWYKHSVFLMLKLGQIGRQLWWSCPPDSECHQNYGQLQHYHLQTVFTSLGFRLCVFFCFEKGYIKQISISTSLDEDTDPNTVKGYVL